MRSILSPRSGLAGLGTSAHPAIHRTWWDERRMARAVVYRRSALSGALAPEEAFRTERARGKPSRSLDDSPATDVRARGGRGPRVRGSGSPGSLRRYHLEPMVHSDLPHLVRGLPSARSEGGGRLKPTAIRPMTPLPFSGEGGRWGQSTPNHASKSARIEPTSARRRVTMIPRLAAARPRARARARGLHTDCRRGRPEIRAPRLLRPGSPRT